MKSPDMTAKQKEKLQRYSNNNIDNNNWKKKKKTNKNKQKKERNSETKKFDETHMNEYTNQSRNSLKQFSKSSNPTSSQKCQHVHHELHTVHLSETMRWFVAVEFIRTKSNKHIEMNGACGGSAQCVCMCVLRVIYREWS